MFWGTIWMGSQALLPDAVGHTINAIAASRVGSTVHADGPYVRWSLIVLTLGVLTAVAGIMRHRCALTNFLRATFTTTQVITNQAGRLGATLARRTEAGEVVTIGTSDLRQVGGVMDATDRGMGAVVGIVVVTIVLLSQSVVIGLLILLGVPLTMFVVGLLLRPFHRRQSAYRREVGKLTAQAGDVIGGLRILRGVGGEDLFARRYATASQEVRRHGVHVAGVESWFTALEGFVPGVLVIAVTWLAARFAVTGHLSAGQLVSFYGYAAFLSQPLSTAGDLADRLTRGLVSANRVAAVLRLEPDVEPAPLRSAGQSSPEGTAAAIAQRGYLVDPDSSLRVRQGSLTAVACELAQGAALADRLGRYTDSTASLDGATLSSLPIDEVRRRILVAQNQSFVFRGTLGSVLDPHGLRTDEELASALETAHADDVLESLGGADDALEAVVTSNAHNLSGGQAQRVRLARALAAQAEVLILLEPTSAVDSHTESLIANGLREARTDPDQTTVMFTTSPLLLAVADEVAYLRDGAVAAVGSHSELLASSRGYLGLVSRKTAEQDDSDVPADGPADDLREAALLDRARGAL